MVFLGCNILITKIDIGARYNLGLADSHDFPTGYGSDRKGWKNNVIQAGLGFLF
jgi:hypothetical protein